MFWTRWTPKAGCFQPAKDKAVRYMQMPLQFIIRPSPASTGILTNQKSIGECTGSESICFTEQDSTYTSPIVVPMLESAKSCFLGPVGGCNLISILRLPREVFTVLPSVFNVVSRRMLLNYLWKLRSSSDRALKFVFESHCKAVRKQAPKKSHYPTPSTPLELLMKNLWSLLSFQNHNWISPFCGRNLVGLHLDFIGESSTNWVLWGFYWNKHEAI